MLRFMLRATSNVQFGFFSNVDKKTMTTRPKRWLSSPIRWDRGDKKKHRMVYFVDPHCGSNFPKSDENHYIDHLKD